MSGIYLSKREIIGALAGICLGIILGFFAGQEYFYYKLGHIVAPIAGQIAGLRGNPTKNEVAAAKKRTAQAQIEMLATSIDLFHLDVGRYPTDEEGLKVLYSKPESLSSWNGPYLDKPAPKDPWGRDFIYKCPGEHGRPYSLSSLGANGQPDGEVPK